MSTTGKQIDWALRQLRRGAYWLLGRIGSLLPQAAKGPSEGRLTFMLLLLSVMVAVWSVGRMHWAPTPGLYTLAFGGVVVGLLLAKIRFMGSVLAITGLLAGLSLSLYYLSSLGDGTTGLERFADVAVRLFTWDRVSEGHDATFGRLLAGFLFVFASWLMGFICSWSLFRKHNIWGAVLPSGIVVVVTVAILPLLAQRLLLYLYLLIVCLLMARLFVLQRDHDWTQRGIRRYHLDSVLPKAFGFALVIVIIGSLLPTPSAKIAPMAAVWRGITWPARAVIEKPPKVAPDVSIEDPVLPHSFGSTSPFRANVTLGENPVLIVKAPFPIYLRARSYDVYTHEGWEASNTQMMSPDVSAGGEPKPGSQKSRQVEVSVKVLFSLIPGEPVYLAGYPVDMSIAYQLEALRPARYEISVSDTEIKVAAEEGKPPLDLQEAVSRLRELRGASHDKLTEADIRSALPEDVQVVSYEFGTDGVGKITVERDVPVPPDTVSVRTAGLVSASNAYQATVSVAAATENDLLAAGTQYPGWVLDRYLQLPDVMPSCVMDLAQNLTKDSATPYQKAAAIRDYLRTLKYTVTIEAPPEGTDGVDYFLFETQKGYCQYFASAMTVLLRACGIPARMVSGYGPGESTDPYGPGNTPGDPGGAGQDSQHTFAVRTSHSWSEVFFPGYGWIQFEPTPTYPVIVHSDTDLPPQDGEGSGDNDDPIVDPDGTQPGTPWDIRLLGLPLGLALFCAAMWLGWRRLLGQVSEPRVAYTRIGYLAALSGLSPRENLTPQEYGRKLATAVPRMAAAVNQIICTYVRASYSNHDLTSEDRSNIAEAWPQARNHLLRHALHRALRLKSLKKWSGD